MANKKSIIEICDDEDIVIVRRRGCRDGQPQPVLPIDPGAEVAEQAPTPAPAVERVGCGCPQPPNDERDGG